MQYKIIKLSLRQYSKVLKEGLQKVDVLFLKNGFKEKMDILSVDEFWASSAITGLIFFRRGDMYRVITNHHEDYHKDC